MARLLVLSFLFLCPLLLSGCASSSEESPGTRVESRVAYAHTDRFLLEEAQAVLLEHWDGIAMLDMAERRLETVWHVHLHPQARFGLRERLVVTLEGEEGNWRVVATEETERNTEQRETLELESAEWESTGNEGAQARAFLLALRLRLRPEPSSRATQGREGVEYAVQAFSTERLPPGASQADEERIARRALEERDHLVDSLGFDFAVVRRSSTERRNVVLVGRTTSRAEAEALMERLRQATRTDGENYRDLSIVGVRR